MSISFPRSGFHLLMRYLSDYFGPNWHWCDNFRCCADIPCRRPKTFLQKNHDFDLTAPKVPGLPYVFQYRAPYPAICSWFEFERAEGLLAADEPSWHRFLVQKTLFWSGLVSRWTRSSATYLPYDTLAADPVSSVSELIAQVTNVPVVVERLKETHRTLQESRLAPPLTPDMETVEVRPADGGKEPVTYRQGRGFARRRVERFQFYREEDREFTDQLAAWSSVRRSTGTLDRTRIVGALQAVGLESVDQLKLQSAPPPLVSALSTALNM